MKRFIWILTTLLALTASVSLVAQEMSSVSILIGYGKVTSDWLSNLYLFDNPYPYYTNKIYDKKFGGFSMSFKILFSAERINPHLRIGGEIGLFTIDDGNSAIQSSVSYYYFNEDSPDDAGVYVIGLANYRLVNISQVAFYLECGGGIMFLSLADGGSTKSWNDEFMIPYFTSTPGPEPIIATRFLAMIRKNKITIEPYIGIMKTFGTTAIFTVNFGVGIGGSL